MKTVLSKSFLTSKLVLLGFAFIVIGILIWARVIGTTHVALFFILGGIAVIVFRYFTTRPVRIKAGTPVSVDDQA